MPAMKRYVPPGQKLEHCMACDKPYLPWHLREPKIGKGPRTVRICHDCLDFTKRYGRREGVELEELLATIATTAEDRAARRS